jgi:hypothetical protein
LSVLDVRTAIVAGLKAALPAGVSVEAHRGRFDSAAEIQRFATKAPMVLVACIRIPVKEPGSGVLMLPASWAVFVITRDIPDSPRDAGALTLVQACLQCIGGNTWGSGETSEPENLDARNLYSSSVDKLGIALWAISFDQMVTDPITDPNELTPFATFHQDIDMAPPDGQIDISETDQLPQ